MIHWAKKLNLSKQLHQSRLIECFQIGLLTQSALVTLSGALRIAASAAESGVARLLLRLGGLSSLKLCSRRILKKPQRRPPIMVRPVVRKLKNNEAEVRRERPTGS